MLAAKDPAEKDENDEEDDEESDAPEESKEGKPGKKRGNTDLLPPMVRQNLMMVFGCAPQFGVKAATKMMLDVRNRMWFKIDKVTLTCNIPAIFDDLKGTDANFEII